VRRIEILIYIANFVGVLLYCTLVAKLPQYIQLTQRTVENAVLPIEWVNLQKQRVIAHIVAVNEMLDRFNLLNAQYKRIFEGLDELIGWKSKCYLMELD